MSAEVKDPRITGLLDRADDVIDAWHENRTVDRAAPLHIVLGMSFETYGTFITKPREWATEVVESGEFEARMKRLSDAIRK